MPNFDIASFNLINWANATPELYDNEPKLVSIIQKDANGNLFTKQVKNRGMIKKELWDDVGGALGQFSKIFYIDQLNGNDNNEGTADAPFKTIKKAIYATPLAGACDVFLIGDYYLKASENRTNISGGRKIRIFGAYTGNEKLTLEYDTQVCFALYTKSMLTLGLDVEVKQTTSNSLIKNVILIDEESFFQIANNKKATLNQGSTINSNVTFTSDYVSLAYCRRSTTNYINVNFNSNSNNNIALMKVGFTSRLNIAFSNIDGNTADTTNVKPLIQGVIRDADSGNPINLLCNLNLSS